MTIDQKGYAILCKDVYNNPPADKFLTLGGVEYKIRRPIQQPGHQLSRHRLPARRHRGSRDPQPWH